MSARSRSADGYTHQPVTMQGIPVTGPEETKYVGGLGEVSTKYPVHVYVAEDDESPVDNPSALDAVGKNAGDHQAVVEYRTEGGSRESFMAAYDEVERLFNGEISARRDAVDPQEEQQNVAGPLRETPSSAYTEQQHRLNLEQPYEEATPERPRAAELYDTAKRDADADGPPGGGLQPSGQELPESEEHDERARLDYRVHTDFLAFKRAAVRDQWADGIDDPAYQ